jgi:hypothetical protein
MHFYMHSYLHKNSYFCKKWVLQLPGWPVRELGREATNFAQFPLLFGTTLFLPLHHSISEDFLTWCSKAHQVRYKYLLQTFNFVE